MVDSLDVQLKSLKRAARKRGLKGPRKDRRLTATPYRAMHPAAAKELDQPCPKKTITYDPSTVKTKRRLVMDLRHEIVEVGEMAKGKKYRPAHRIANRKQLTLGAAGEEVGNA
jgi:hypothetical protein